MREEGGGGGLAAEKPHGGSEGAAGHAGAAQPVPAAEPRRQPKPSASWGQGNSKDLRRELTFQKSCESAWFFSPGGSKLQLCRYFQSCANVSLGSLAPYGVFFPPHQGYKLESPFFSSSVCRENLLPHRTMVFPSPITSPYSQNRGRCRHGAAPVPKEGEAGPGGLSPNQTSWTGNGTRAVGRASGVSVPPCAQTHRDSEAANAELGSSNSYFYFLYNAV